MLSMCVVNVYVHTVHVAIVYAMYGTCLIQLWSEASWEFVSHRSSMIYVVHVVGQIWVYVQWLHVTVLLYYNTNSLIQCQ